MKDKTECTLANGFNLWEKKYAQSSFIGMGIIGTVGIMLVDWRWILPYLLIYAYGVLGVVMRHLVCPRCPHLFVYNDCLQCHPRITMWLVKEQKTTPFSPFEKLLFCMIFILVCSYCLMSCMIFPKVVGIVKSLRRQSISAVKAASKV